MTIFSYCFLSCVIFSSDGSGSATHARRIDDYLAKIYSEESIVANPVVEDLSFLRRANLDLVGRIPTLEEIEAYKANPDREKLVDRLIDSDEFDQFTSEAWTTWLIGYSNAFQTDRETFRIWLSDQLKNDSSFKTIVSQILTAEGSTAINGPTNFLARHFEQPTTAVCRSFLGVRLECAQCHDHPFDQWTQNDYEAMKSFFQPLLRRNENGVAAIFDDNRRRSEGPKPVFLTGSKPRTQRYRQELALYLTNCKPFARNFANRVWYYLMGRGIVDPPDDFNQENQPVDRDLLELLTQIARDSDFDIKEMFRIVCKTQAYQRAVANAENSQSSIRLFAAKTIKPVLPVQYLNSLLVGLERDLPFSERRQLLRRLINLQDLNEDYQRLWEYRESIQQLMNKITFEFQGSIKDNQKTNTSNMFLRLLTRQPTVKELKFCEGQKAADIMFALALSNEFFFNH